MALSQVGLERLTTTTTDKIGERKNLIINGAMQVSQRGTSEASVSTTKYANAPDRWRFVAGNGGTWTVSQSTTSPNLFANSYKFDCTTADSSLGAGDFLAFDQGLEGLDLQDLGWGTSDAKSVTVSFHVRSNKTGTYTCELFQGAGGVGGSNILVSKSYTIGVADTWEKKTITFSGNTAVAFTNDNSRQLTLNLWLAAGSNFTGGTFSDGTYHNANNKRVASGQVNLADSTSNEWYITGVQIEVGSVATDFEHKSYGDTLWDCQRYCSQIGRADSGEDIYTLFGLQAYGTSAIFGTIGHWPRQMRAKPTVTLVGVIQYTNSAAGNVFSPTGGTYNRSTKNSVGSTALSFGSSLFVQGGFAAAFAGAADGANYIQGDAEL
jgi:hypothetical protein